MGWATRLIFAPRPFFMRLFLPLLVLLAPMSSLPLAADGLELVRVWPGYRDAASFTSIGEYFGGTEPIRGRTVLRSQPDSREGFYWLVRTRADEALADLRLEITVLRTDPPDTEHFEFNFSLPAGSHPVYAGLTGSDWTDPETRPRAWHLTILTRDGTVLATEQSFLWENPKP